MKKELYQAVCPYCNYAWPARVETPKACPRCKRRLDKPVNEKVVKPAKFAEGIVFCSSCQQKVGVVEYRGKHYCKSCVLQVLEEDLKDISYEDALQKLREQQVTLTGPQQLICERCRLHDPEKICIHPDFDINKPFCGVGFEGNYCKSFVER